MCTLLVWTCVFVKISTCAWKGLPEEREAGRKGTTRIAEQERYTTAPAELEVGWFHPRYRDRQGGTNERYRRDTAGCHGEDRTGLHTFSFFHPLKFHRLWGLGRGIHK